MTELRPFSKLRVPDASCMHIYRCTQLMFLTWLQLCLECSVGPLCCLTCPRSGPYILIIHPPSSIIPHLSFVVGCLTTKTKRSLLQAGTSHKTVSHFANGLLHHYNNHSFKWNIGHTRRMYHAAYKVENQPLTMSNSQLTYL